MLSPQVSAYHRHEVIFGCVAFPSASDEDRRLVAIGENVRHSMHKIECSRANEDSKYLCLLRLGAMILSVTIVGLDGELVNPKTRKCVKNDSHASTIDP